MSYVVCRYMSYDIVCIHEYSEYVISILYIECPSLVLVAYTLMIHTYTHCRMTYDHYVSSVTSVRHLSLFLYAHKRIYLYFNV